MILSILFYLMKKYRQKPVQVLTLESFLQASWEEETSGRRVQ
ncbi:hypothetical protein [Rossellomorea sp. LJF3]